MKKIVILILSLLLLLPVFAQVGRYKTIKLWYPGYSLKFDTATGELWAIHLDEETGTLEEVISKKLSHTPRQVGRYEFRRTRHLGTYQIFDTVSGEYTTVKWAPKDQEGKTIEDNVDSAVSTAVEGLINLFKGMEEGLGRLQENFERELRDSVAVEESPAAAQPQDV